MSLQKRPCDQCGDDRPARSTSEVRTEDGRRVHFCKDRVLCRRAKRLEQAAVHAAKGGAPDDAGWFRKVRDLISAHLPKAVSA